MIKKPVDRQTNPRLTVVTVSCNAQAMIEQTIRSVAAQNADGIEYLVIDGASNDGTVDVLRRLSYLINHWVSEPDHGIYDAMNKGIAMAQGDWIMFLNADDYLHSEKSLQTLLAATDDLIDIVAGQTLKKSADREWMYCPRQRLGLRVQLPFLHPSTIVRRSALVSCGNFDTRYKLAADGDLFLRMLRRGHQYRCINQVVTVMREGGASQRNFMRGRIEYMQAYWRNMQDPFGACLGFVASMAMHLKAKLP